MLVSCPNCSYDNSDIAVFCANCGSSLPRKVASATAGVSGTVATPLAPVSYQPTWRDYADAQAIRRTRTGLLLLVIGFVLVAIPFVNIIGILISIVAVILIYLGADAFGRRHKRNVLWSIFSFILLIIGILVAVFASVGAFVGAALAGASREGLLPVWLTVVVIIGVGTSLLAIPFLLITYELQANRGRTTLWVAVAVTLAVAGGSASYFYTLFDSFLEVILGGASGIGALTANPVLQYVAPLSNLVWAYGYYLAHDRVFRDEIPVRSTPSPPPSYGPG